MIDDDADKGAARFLEDLVITQEAKIADMRAQIKGLQEDRAELDARLMRMKQWLDDTGRCPKCAEAICDNCDGVER